MLSRPVPNSVWSSNQLLRWLETQIVPTVQNSIQSYLYTVLWRSLKCLATRILAKWNDNNAHSEDVAIWHVDVVDATEAFVEFAGIHFTPFFWHKLHSDSSPCIFSSLEKNVKSARLTELVVWLTQMGQLENLCLVNNKPFEKHLPMEEDITKKDYLNESLTFQSSWSIWNPCASICLSQNTLFRPLDPCLKAHPKQVRRNGFAKNGDIKWIVF